MIKWIIGIVSCILMSACAKPISDFKILSESQVAPTHIEFKNLSTGSENYIWKVDSEIVSDSTHLSHLFLSSGRHTIELVSSKGSKQSKSHQDLFIEAPAKCLVHILTNYGSLVVSLSDKTPRHRDNFLQLVNSSFYDGIKFHRIINGFMIQAGDPKTNLASQKIKHPKEIEQEIDNELLHYRGALAAARLPDNINPNKASSGTQFYIVEGQQLTAKAIEEYGYSRLEDYTEEQKLKYLENGGAPQLDGEYTVFGQLIEGFDTLDKISDVKTDKSNKPIDPVIIIKTTSVN